MATGDRSPDEVIEQALVRIRRDQQAARLQGRSAAVGALGGRRLDAARFRYLDALESAGGGAPISQVAEAIGVDRPRASRLTRDLVEAGLVRRTTVPGDGRVIRVELTPAGREPVEAAHRARRESVRRALAGFTTAEARDLAALLDRFVTDWPRPAR